MCPIFDAHNHLQDGELTPYREELLKGLPRWGVAGGVINGTKPADWGCVRAICAEYPQWLPSYGIHPWEVEQAGADWLELLGEFVGETGTVGEIGLDAWKTKENLPLQKKIFVSQLQYAAKRNIPVTIHCLKVWGSLLEILREEDLPECGFLLHAFGGPIEMIEELTRLGAYFSFNGNFLDRPSKMAAFVSIPEDRLLLETDAPAMPPPPQFSSLELPCTSLGKRLHHPGNLRAVCDALANYLGKDPATIAAITSENFQRLFGKRLILHGQSCGAVVCHDRCGECNR